MNCQEARQHWELYHDSEGDPDLFRRINEHLDNCPACAEWFHNESRLEELIAERLSTQEATPELWARVLAGAGVQPSRAPSLRRWLFFASTLAVAACLLIAVSIWHQPHAESLSRLSADVHGALVSGRTSVEFPSGSDAEVERFLVETAGFPVRCPPRADSGFAVSGAGTCLLGEGSAAYLVGEVDGNAVSIFILPAERLAEFPHQRDALLREPVHRCREGNLQMVMGAIDRNVVLVVGGSRPEPLERILSYYGTYPHDDHG